MANQPPTFWSLVENWRQAEVEYTAKGQIGYAGLLHVCADELAALVKAHAEELKRLGFRQSPYNTEGICIYILGVPREERK